MSIDLIEAGLEELLEEESKKMASGLHSAISMRVGRRLAAYVDDRKLGYVLDSSATYDFNDGLRKRQPAVSFINSEKLPVLLDQELTVAPDLVVEVVSKNDSVYEVAQKVDQYQKAGVRLIWIVNPAAQTAEVYRLATGLKVQGLIGEDELDGEDVLPGFRLTVKTLFE